jgi:pyruvate dehydrogenase E2 component (dihydrolipoamide acetyltransferase)
MALVEVKVPDIGDFDEVSVIELLVKPGDTVKAEQSLITVESDKASMEIPSSHAGVVQSISVQLGDKVKQGSVIVLLQATDSAAAVPPEQPAAVASSPALAPAAVAASASPAAPSPVGTVEVRVPDIGDFKDVTVIEVFVKPGDAVKLEQSLVTVESDKASMEIPSSAAGVIKQMAVKLGDKINIGDLLGPIIGLLEDQNANVRPRALVCPPHGATAPRAHVGPSLPGTSLPHVLCNMLCGADGVLLHRRPRVCRCARQQCKPWSASTGTSASR